MSLEQEIVDWSASKPWWQRRILRLSANGKAFTSSDYDELLEAITLTKPSNETESFSLSDFPRTSYGDPSVSLVSLGNPEHVNALVSDQPLSFASTGITLIYGDNASGKSGYARLLKSITRSRHKEEVLSDVFRETQVVKPRAELSILIGSQSRSLAWPTEMLPELQRMLFYDEACGDGYIETESDFPYRPTALFVMDSLIRACSELRSRLDIKLLENASNRKTVPVVPDELKGTPVGMLLGNLSHSSSVQRVDDVLEKLETSVEDVEQLKEQEKQLQNTDVSGTIRDLRRQRDKLEGLRKHIAELQSQFEDSAVIRLQEQRKDLEALRDAAQLISRSFSTEPVKGVGTDSWRELWESARKFSKIDAYPGKEFPPIAEEDRCLLCHQQLDQGASTRLAKFEAFVKEDTQTKLTEANERWVERSDKLRRCEGTPTAIEMLLADLDSNHSELVEETREFLAGYDVARRQTLNLLDANKDTPLPGLDYPRVISKLVASIDTTQKTLQALGNPEDAKRRLAEVTQRRKELELLNAVKIARTTIHDEISRLKESKKLEDLKTAAATGPITRKISELSEDSITEVVRDRFTRESERLRLSRVTISKTRGDKGKLLHQPKLVGARQTVALPRVFSEGEQTALGLAAFFTDAVLDASKSALILDDPVSSLDHIRRHLVATRLVELATERQVVVFTHDVSFVADLKREAVGIGIPIADRSITRTLGKNSNPGTCGSKHPWKAKDAKQRIGFLRDELARIEKELNAWDNETYETQVALWAGNLSETWERIFSQEIVGAVIADGGMEVRPMMVKVLARFTDADQSEFQASYSRVSKWVKRHDKSSKANYVAPDIKELEDELALVTGWFDRIKTYKN